MHEEHRTRIRKKYYNAYREGSGLGSFEDHEALEMLLFYAIPRQNTNDTGHYLMYTFGSLGGILDAHVDDLTKVPGVGEASAMLISMIKPLYEKACLGKPQIKQRIASIQEAGEYCVNVLKGKRVEHLYVICLDSSFRVTFEGHIQKGAIESIPIYPRQIAEVCIRHNASYVILAHNHPGGRMKPSNTDISTTKKIINALTPIGIKVMDNFIIADGKYYSFYENLNLEEDTAAENIAMLELNKTAVKRPSELIAAQDSNLLID